MLRNIGRITVCLMAVGGFACSLLSDNSDGVVLAPTEVGTPEGPAVTKDIGPAGGTLASPDGRFTLAVPQNAVTETMTFSIQPITNKVQTGLGLAYRFGPDGKTFKTPLELAVRYDEHDLEGTAAEALSVGFQDNEGNWHVLKPKSFDSANKRITVPITHFTDFSIFTRFQISPTEATIRPGKSLIVRLLRMCKPQKNWERWVGRTPDCSTVPVESENWKLQGPGAIQVLTSESGVYYIAPARKPDYPEATVKVTIRFSDTDMIWNPATGELSKGEKTFSSWIHIRDQAYQAIGQHGDLTLSGVICNLDEPFTVPGVITGYPMKYQFRFTPSSRTAGSVKISGAGGLVRAEGSGTYTVEGLETGTPKIVMKTETNVGHAPPGSVTGPLGTGDLLNLLPLENTECRDG